MRLLWILTLALILPGELSAQEKKEPGPIQVIKLERKEPVVFEKDIEPIFNKKCVTCHSGSVKEGRFDISTYEGLVKGGKRGTTITPGKSESSLLYKTSARTIKPFMPPRDEVPLTSEEVALIRMWIDEGAKAPSGMRERPKIVVGLPPDNVNPVRAVAVNAEKVPLVAASRGNQIHLYEGIKGEYVRNLVDPNLKMPGGKPVKAAHLSLVQSLAFSPDGQFLVSGSFQEIAIWDPRTGDLKHKITGFNHDVVALAFSQNGKLLAIGGGPPTEEGEVKIFEVGSWKLAREIKNGHSDTVYGLAFSPDGKMIVTGSADKFVKVWEVDTGKFVKSFEGHTHHVLDVGWSADGRTIASAGGDNTVKVWDFEKGEQARTINAHGKQVTRLLFIGNKHEIVTGGGDAQVKMFNVDNGGNTRNFPGGTDFVYAIGVNPEGTVVAAGGQEGSVRLYNGNSSQLIRTLLPPDAQPPAKQEEKKK